MYDGWQGQSQIITSPPRPLEFNLSLNEDASDEISPRNLQDNDSRLMEMLAAQAAHRGDGSADEEAIIKDKKLPEAQKKAMLQKSLHNAASNGDVEQVGRLLNGPARKFIDINGPDEEGTAPMIYASCFVSVFKRVENIQESNRQQYRGIKMLCQLCWKQELRSTGRTRINGRP